MLCAMEKCSFRKPPFLNRNSHAYASSFASFDNIAAALMYRAERRDTTARYSISDLQSNNTDRSNDRGCIDDNHGSASHRSVCRNDQRVATPAPPAKECGRYRTARSSKGIVR